MDACIDAACVHVRFEFGRVDIDSYVSWDHVCSDVVYVNVCISKRLIRVVECTWGKE